MIHGVVAAVLDPDNDYLPAGKLEHVTLLSVVTPCADPLHRDLDGLEFCHVVPIQHLLLTMRGVMATIPPTVFRMREPKVRLGQTRTMAVAGRHDVLQHVQQQIIMMLYEAHHDALRSHDDAPWGRRRQQCPSTTDAQHGHDGGIGADRWTKRMCLAAGRRVTVGVVTFPVLL